MGVNILPPKSQPEGTDRIIGGMFGLEQVPVPRGSTPPFLTDSAILLDAARSGIYVLLHLLPVRQIWLPSYFCNSVLWAIDQQRTPVKFYEINYNLSIPSDVWLDAVQPNDLVIFIDYFGFVGDTSWVKQAKERGAWVLEDASQALLSTDVGKVADFTLYSPRKYLGVPDGGILVSNSDIGFDEIELIPASPEWWLTAFSACTMRREFDLHGGNRDWFKLFQVRENEAPVGFYSMSQLSEMLLKHGFDYSSISQRRRNNYNLLADALADIALFPSLPAQTVPLGFPIRLKNRDEVRQLLFDHNIYPPVHWQLENSVPQEFAASHQLSAEIMTLPCDQRYGNDDMERMIQRVRNAKAAGQL